MLVDVGVNLLNSQFRRDRNEVISRAREAGVGDMLVISTDLADARTAIEQLSVTGLCCTAGVHPHDAKDVASDWLDELRDLARHPAVRAIGETGLDFNRNYSPASVQLDVFRAQISLAQEVGKPLYVHDRESDGALSEALLQAGDLPPVLIHCFTGTAAELHNYLAAGFYIGVTGWVTDPKRGAQLRQLIPRIPLQRLLLETDAPFLRPFTIPTSFVADHNLSSRYKRRCEPAMLPAVLEAIAELRSESAQDIAKATCANARLLFGLKELSS